MGISLRFILVFHGLTRRLVLNIDQLQWFKRLWLWNRIVTDSSLKNCRISSVYNWSLLLVALQVNDWVEKLFFVRLALPLGRRCVIVIQYGWFGLLSCDTTCLLLDRQGAVDGNSRAWPQGQLLMTTGWGNEIDHVPAGDISRRHDSLVTLV